MMPQQYQHWQQWNYSGTTLTMCGAAPSHNDPHFLSGLCMVSSPYGVYWLTEPQKAVLYKALYDDGMRIDRATWIIKEAK